MVFHSNRDVETAEEDSEPLASRDEGQVASGEEKKKRGQNGSLDE